MKKNARNLLLLSSLTGIGIYGLNKAVSICSVMKNLLKTDDGNFFHWKYGDIYYTKYGKGKPVILIHDLVPDSSSYEWEKVIKQLSKHHTVYALDLLGCGRSDKPNMTYSNFLFVQLISDFIRTIVTEQADIIATGNSCSFALMACNMNPELFDKIIIVNPINLPALCKTPNKRKNALKFLIDLPLIGTLIFNIAFSQRNVVKTFCKDYYATEYMVPSKIIDIYYESAHRNSSRGKYLLSSITANYTNINIIHALKKLNNSIYLIGSSEQPGMNEIIDSYIQYNPSIEGTILTGSKYLPQLEIPEKFLDTVNLYLESK